MNNASFKRLWLLLVCWLYCMSGACDFGSNWTCVTSTADWSSRRFHAAVEFEGRLVVCGGMDSGGVNMNDVWQSADGSNWTVVTRNAPWRARIAHAVLVFSNKLWIVGGYGDIPPYYIADVWSSADGTNWTCVTASAPWLPRANVMCVVHEGKMWLAGGCAGGGGANDVWSSSDGTNWTRVTAHAPWSDRYAHGAATFMDRIWVLGGYDGSARNDVWSSADGTNWTCATTSAAWGSRMIDQGVTVAGSTMWLMAGRSPGSNAGWGDVWWTTNGAQWARATAMAPWQARSAPACASFGNSFWVLGGNRDGVGCKNDAWYSGDISSAVDITTTPAAVSYYTTSATVSGTNGAGIVGDMWVSNAANGDVHSFPAAEGWTTPGITLAEGPNAISVCGSNEVGSVSSDRVTLRRAYESERPLLDPFTNVTVREHQVFFGQARGRANIVSVQCVPAPNMGVAAFDDSSWRFSCIPGYGAAGQTWNIAFISANAFGVETQVLAVAVAAPAKGLGPKKPSTFEDVDGDILDIKCSGVKKAGSVVLFDGWDLVVSNAEAGGKLSLSVKQNKKSGGNGSFTLRELRMDNSSKAVSLGCNVDAVRLDNYRVDSLKFSGKGTTISNVFLESAKSISASKATLAGTVAVSNGFDVLTAQMIDHGRILAGVAPTANCTNTPARATFKSVKAGVMMNAVVAGRDVLNGTKVVAPVVKATTAFDSQFFHTLLNNTVQSEEIMGQ